MGPERKLYQKVKKNISDISWIRLENSSLHGTPDLLGYNTSGTFFTLKLKIKKKKKKKPFPPQNFFFLKTPLHFFFFFWNQKKSPLNFSFFVKGPFFPPFPELVACGLELEPLCLTLDACGLFLQELGA